MRRHAKAIAAISALLLTLAFGATLAGAVAPLVTIEPVSSVSYTSALAHGNVDPQDQDVSACRFDYIDDGSYQANQGEGGSGFDFAPSVSCETDLSNLTAGSGPTAVQANLSGLAPGTTYHLRLVAENSDGSTAAEGSGTFTTESVAPPAVSIDPVTTFTGTTAHFSGSIDPEAPGGNPPAFDVNWHFECIPSCPGLEGSIPADSSTHTVEANATGLEPNTSYEVSLVASNAGGSASAGPESFETQMVAPEVQALYAGSITIDGAVLAATVNPRNAAVTYQFEWGTDKGYGSSIPLNPELLGTEDDSPHVVTAPISGLERGSTYHFRVVATNTTTSQVSKGLDRSFTTLDAFTPPLSGLPDGRVYERVSPMDKNGGDVRRVSEHSFFHGTNQAARSGDAVAYQALGNFGGDSAPVFSQYLATRGPDGWTTKGISPRLDPTPCSPCGSLVDWLSEDLSLASMVTSRLDPGDPFSRFNLYLRYNSTDTHRLISLGEPPVSPSGAGDVDSVWDASADGSHVIFSAGEPVLTADSPPDLNLYEWVDGHVRLAAVLPNGEAIHNAAISGLSTSSPFFPGQNVISNDGRRVFFEGYMREDGTTTRAIAPENAEFEFATPEDGSVAFTTTSGFLAEDRNLYRWTASAPPGEDVTNLTTGDPSGAGVQGFVGASDSGDRAYFVATGVLAPGATEGQSNLYLWQQDAGVRYIATLDGPADSNVWGDTVLNSSSDVFRDSRVTSDGSLLAFRSHARLTSYDNAAQNAIYLYSAARDQLVCVSCNERASHSAADAYFLFGQEHGDPNLILQRNLSSDGRVFFDSAEALVPTDTDGTVDVYEWENGQVYLISSGNSGRDSMFLDAGASGRDVFFTTGEPLARTDTDTIIDVYDARIGGREDPSPAVKCLGDECQGTPSAPPQWAGPGSGSLQGAGNVPPAKRSSAKRCRSGRRRVARHGRSRCVAKKHNRSKAGGKGK